MKSTERHGLRRNELLEALRSPCKLARKYGLPVLIVVAALIVSLLLIGHAHTAGVRKRTQARQNLAQAVEDRSEDQLRAIAASSKNGELIRAWAQIRLAEFLYNKSQQLEYYSDRASRIDLLKAAVKACQDALQIGTDRLRIEGQANCIMGICYENLGREREARLRYEVITSQAERFAGTVWLNQAGQRIGLLDRFADEKVTFDTQPLINLPAVPLPTE